MLNHSYRLSSPKQIRIDIVEENLHDDDIIVRPTYLSICAADKRYFFGLRKPEILRKKLPMALIHEAVGEVIYDPKGLYKKGTKVVMIPNTPVEKSGVIKENYLRSSKFKSSGIDGFMQSFVCISRNRVIEYKKIPDRVAVLLELLSVSMNALDHFKNYSHKNKLTLGVWGCGNVGLCTALILKYAYKDAKIVAFDADETKLNYLPFVDETYLVNEVPEDLRVDHAFECVGGPKSENAINQIIDIINPQGTIALLGVNENNVPINTRMVLEKGLTLIGNSRSSYEDFKASIDFLENNKDAVDYLTNIISEEIIVNDVKDITKAFEASANNDYKTIMRWKI